MLTIFDKHMLTIFGKHMLTIFGKHMLTIFGKHMLTIFGRYMCVVIDVLCRTLRRYLRCMCPIWRYIMRMDMICWIHDTRHPNWRICRKLPSCPVYVVLELEIVGSWALM